MRIDSGAAQAALAAYRSTAADPTRSATDGTQAAGATSKPQAPDSAEISTHGRQFAQALDAVRQSPDTRTQLVASLRNQVQTGTYTVNGQQLAAKIAQHIDLGA